MKKTVFITGSSMGIGLETALYFHNNGWNVAATMLHPSQLETPLHRTNDIYLHHLDVTDETSIHASVDGAIERFGSLDVVVNNAGYGVFGTFEASTNDQINKQMNTNFFGPLNIIREVIPYFRKRKGGTFVNITSIGGRVAFPLWTLYHASKWAVEGFSEALQFELKQFNIKIKIVEPGPIATQFFKESLVRTHKEGLTAYDNFEEKVLKKSTAINDKAAQPLVVAKTVFKAANDQSSRMRYPAAGMAFIMMRKILPERAFIKLVEKLVIN